MFITLFSVFLVSVVAFFYMNKKGQALKKELSYLFDFVQNVRLRKQSLPKIQRGELNLKEDDLICKQSFNSHRDLVTKTKWDYIIIGSGIGGLTCGRLLSAYGKKVLVLEQHDITGGCTHSYVERGWEFDTGIHYIGGMQGKSISGKIMDFLTANHLKWEEMDAVYDAAVFPDKTYNYETPKEKLINNLKEAFPNESSNIDRYFDYVIRTTKDFGLYSQQFVLPPILLSLFKKLVSFSSNYISLIRDSGLARWPVEASKTVKQVLDSISQNEKLRSVLAHPFGDYGLPPSKGSWGIHSLVVQHYFQGAYYPVKGSQHISKVMVGLIEQAGGKVLVKAEVGKIIIKGNKAIGVELKKDGTQLYCNEGVISTAGARKTFLSFLPPIDLFRGCYNFKDTESNNQSQGEIRVKDKYTNEFDFLKKVLRRDPGFAPSCGHLYLFIGLNGSDEELKLPKSNFWCYAGYDHDKMVEEYYSDMSKEFPCCFVSFASSKDPEYSQRHPGKSTCIIVTEGNYDWFSPYKNGRVRHRGEDYEKIKEELGQRLLAVFTKHFPHLKDKIGYYEVGTPITNNYYIGSLHGESYGSLEHSPQRFSECLSSFTPVENLFLSGQDVTSAGFTGGMFGGVVTSMCALKRDILGDIKIVTRGTVNQK